MYTEFDDIYAEIMICTFIYLFNIHIYYWNRCLFSFRNLSNIRYL